MIFIFKVVDVCTRVEGHGNVNILIQKDEIKRVEFEIGAFRGFENFLLNKKLLDMPRIVSRICGLCHASQTIASCKAIESMYGVEIPEQSVLLRRLLMTGELIKSNSMHFFFQSFPDLSLIFNIHQKPLDPYELIKFDPQLTTNLYELIKIGNDIDRIFGGKSIHLISPIPGGIIYAPSRKNVTIVKRYLLKALSNIEWIIEKFINLFASLSPPEEYNLPNPTFLALYNESGSLDRYLGNLRIKAPKSKPIDFSINNYDKYFNKDSGLMGINFNEDCGENVMVGPMARYGILETYNVDEIITYLNNFSKEWKNSVLFANVLRLVEMYVETKQALVMLEDPVLNARVPLPSLSSVKKKIGIGVVEAPRGTLMHQYRTNGKDEIVEDVKLFIATEFNLPIINKMITKYAQGLYEKTGDTDLIKKKVQLIIRAFDPCISCATH